jgi:hypothetical protein
MVCLIIVAVLLALVILPALPALGVGVLKLIQITLQYGGWLAIVVLSVYLKKMG